MDKEIIRYLDKLYLPDSYYVMFRDCFNEYISDNFEDLINKLHKFKDIIYADPKQNTVSIYIYNNSIDVCNKNKKITEYQNGTSYRDLKDIYTKSVYCRRVILSKDLDIIYGERFNYYIDDECSNDMFFDYGVLYGNTSYSKDDIVVADFYGEEDIREFYKDIGGIPLKLYEAEMNSRLDELVTELVGDMYIGYYEEYLVNDRLSNIHLDYDYFHNHLIPIESVRPYKIDKEDE